MKAVRVAFLLLLLVVVAFYTKLQRIESTSWASPLVVSIYPINADGHVLTQRYISTLSKRDFSSIETFFVKQWSQYSDLDFNPVELTLRDAVLVQPPEPPTNNNVLSVVFWSLRLRFWSYQQAVASDKNTVNVFVRYHQPKENQTLAHSLGLQKGLIGVVNGYALTDYQERNNLVVAHELLHTVGASDKYSLMTGQPLYPDGFASPEAEYSQTRAEIMAGKIPLSEHESVMPESLRQCVIGKKTAIEIHWMNDKADVNQ